MSVQQYKTSDGTQWRVRWREADGKMRSRTVVNKREALALAADLKARKFKSRTAPSLMDWAAASPRSPRTTDRSAPAP